MDVEPQRSLIDRLRAGDERALEEVHAAYHARLFNFLARLARNRDVAEDLLEETWLRLVSHAHRLRPDTNIGAWLFTVGRNLYISYCRSRLIETGHALETVGLFACAGSRASPFEVTAANETERRIEAALAALPTPYREVLLLVGVEGLSPGDAAIVCGVSPEALRQRLHRARTMLTSRLEAAEAPALPGLSEAWP